MNHTNPSTSTIETRCCAGCKQNLPLDAFYFNTPRQCPDRYCKECRKKYSRKHREQKECTQCENKPRIYPVITRIKNRKTRSALILHALHVVRESVKRKQKRDREKEYSLDL